MKTELVKNKPELREATIEDFKPGTTLITKEDYVFVLDFKYDDGIWEARSEGGGKCIFECEAHFYKTLA